MVDDPQTVNAVQLPLQNAMNFPAAILEAPFFDPAADDAANYGSIGAVIGHEVNHGFDNLGSEFDAEGRLRNWWTPRMPRFKAATDKLVAQYDAYEALPACTSAASRPWARTSPTSPACRPRTPRTTSRSAATKRR